MKIKIRHARLEDAPEFIKIKNSLSFKNVNGDITRGGFLLGTDIDTYKKYIANDYCLVAEAENELVGFGIVLNNESVKNSDIWIRRHSANWSLDIGEFENKKMCYFEQLAFKIGYSKSVIQLCYTMMNLIIEEHDYMFTTTVHSPILNLAAVPFILKANGLKVGDIDEHYKEIGHIKSDIYLIVSKNYLYQLENTNLGMFLKSRYNDVLL